MPQRRGIYAQHVRVVRFLESRGVKSVVSLVLLAGSVFMCELRYQKKSNNREQRASAYIMKQAFRTLLMHARFCSGIRSHT